MNLVVVTTASGCIVLILKLDLLSSQEPPVVALKEWSLEGKAQVFSNMLFYCTEHEAQQTWLFATCCKKNEKAAVKGSGTWHPGSKVQATSKAWPHGGKGNLTLFHPCSLSAADRHEPVCI